MSFSLNCVFDAGDFIAWFLFNAGDSPMLKKSSDFLHLGLRTVDGMTGQIEDLCFDDAEWIVRYLAVSAHVWGHRHALLVPPSALCGPCKNGREYRAELSSAEVLDSPRVESDPPVYVQREFDREHLPEYRRLFGNDFAVSLGEAARQFYFGEATRHRPPDSHPRPLPDPHLRSTCHISGYSVHATDGKAGTVEDFLIDETSWEVGYIVLRQSGSSLQRRLLVPPEAVGRISWTSREIMLGATCDAVRAGPHYDPTLPLTLASAQRLHEQFREARLQNRSKASRAAQDTNG